MILNNDSRFVFVNFVIQAKSDSELELKKIEHKIARNQKDKKDAAKTVRFFNVFQSLLSKLIKLNFKVDDMRRAFEWIDGEKQYFGVSGTHVLILIDSNLV